MTVSEIEKRVKDVQHGFKEMKEVSEVLLLQNTDKENLHLAKELLNSKFHQVRMVGVFILGELSYKIPEAFKILKDTVSKDEDWRVQEMLARAFDTYCSRNGYEKSLSVIKEWLKDKNPNTKRAVTEGLRIWTSREYFKENPEIAIKLVSNLKNDESEYVRKSVGNAIRDISKKHKDLVKKELETWNIKDKNILFTYKLASKFI